MTRRELLALGSAGILASARQPASADITLRLTELTVDLGHGHTVKTVGYNGQVPGPLLRMKEGANTVVDVVNETPLPEMVHWHGFHIPPEVDGAHEEGTPMVQAKDKRRFVFSANPAGTRWYHAHAMAGHNLNRGTYTGQFGMVIVEPASAPASYDLEVPLILHEWNPFFSSDMKMDVDYTTFTINGKMLGAGESIRVRSKQQVLFRVLNASATRQHRLALPGHRFKVIALDGNPVPNPLQVPLLDLAPGERVDAIVEMTTPGVWVFGEEDDRQRKGGAGIVVEYANAKGSPRWTRPEPFVWDYTSFGTKESSPQPASTVKFVIEPGTNGNLWAINGKSYPNTDLFTMASGVRNRLIFDNRSDMSHPVHLHRHSLEITNYAGKPSAGVLKDVLIVPANASVAVDVMATSPGPSLFHCHHQFHMDFGFMALMRY